MKAILLIDLPNNWRAEDTEVIRMYLGNVKEKQETVYYNLLLRPIPKKKIHIAKYNIWTGCSKEDKELMLENKGYNNCIDEILGVTI